MSNARKRRRHSPEFKAKVAMDRKVLIAPLYQEIGRLKMVLDWLKKSWPCRLRRNDNAWNPSIPCGEIPSFNVVFAGCWTL